MGSGGRIPKQKENNLGPGFDKVDALVADFLRQLAAIVPDKKDTPQPQEITEKVIGSAAELVESDQDSQPELFLHLKAIDKEIQESLDELENLKSKLIPIEQSKDRKLEPEEEERAQVDAPGPAAVSPEVPDQRALLPEISQAKAEDWDKFELFRSQAASQRRPARLKTIFGIIILVLIAGIIIYWILRLGLAQTPQARDRTVLSSDSYMQASDCKAADYRVKIEMVYKGTPACLFWAPIAAGVLTKYCRPEAPFSVNSVFSRIEI